MSYGFLSLSGPVRNGQRNDPDALHRALTARGLVYRPDPMGRIGQREWIAPDGRTLVPHEVQAAVRGMLRPASAEAEVQPPARVRHRYTTREWANLRLFGTATPSQADHDRVLGEKARARSAELERIAATLDRRTDARAAEAARTDAAASADAERAAQDPMVPHAPDAPRSNDPEAVGGRHPRYSSQPRNRQGIWESVTVGTRGAFLQADADGPVDLAQALEELNFRADRLSATARALPHMFRRDEAAAFANEAIRETRKRFGAENGGMRDNAADAFRHALWSYLIAKDSGPDAAKAFTDYHEVDRRNADGEMVMDLFNNAVGIRLAQNPENRDRDPAEVVIEALESGALRTRPFEAQ